MANFAYVKDSIVQEAFDHLPLNWKNYSNFNALEGDTDYLKSIGWYSIIRQEPTYDSSIKTLGSLTYTFDGDQVIESNEVIDKPPVYTPPSKSQEELIADEWVTIRLTRDQKMAEADWRYNRYARQVRLELTPTDDIAALDAYMQALADITSVEDPFTITWPTL